MKTKLPALWSTRLAKAIQRTTDFFRGIKRVLIRVTKRGSKRLDSFEIDVLRNISDYDMNNLLNFGAGMSAGGGLIARVSCKKFSSRKRFVCVPGLGKPPKAFSYSDLLGSARVARLLPWL